MKLEILPSFLAADLGRLADELRRAEASGADAIHLDIMDPHFVPNMSFGPSIVDFCRKTCPEFYRNVHLMMSRFGQRSLSHVTFGRHSAMNFCPP